MNSPRLLLSFFLIFSLSCATKPKPTNCKQVRGAIDMGSGSTKAYLAKVDVCNGKIIEKLWSEQIKIGFKETLQNAPDKKFDSQIIAQARTHFLQLLQKMRERKAERITAVATAAFREAVNGAQAVTLISATSGVPIRIVTQEEEARLGVKAAQAVSKAEPERYGVWDIGGGSMQISYRDKEGNPRVYQGDLASVNFKDLVLVKIQKKNAAKAKSPNPLGRAQAPAVETARQYCLANSPTDLREQAPTLHWLGIGGVWWHSLRKQVGVDDEIKDQKLDDTLKLRAKLKDKEIGGDYATTDVTNLALVLGFMRCLGITQVMPVNASLVQALVLE